MTSRILPDRWDAPQKIERRAGRSIGASPARGMRKTILMMLVAVASSSALAAWVEVDRTEMGSLYVDLATIRRADDRVKMWELFDYKTAQASPVKSYLSMRAQTEYDCKEGRTRALNISAHSGSMAGGEVVSTTSDPGNWSPISRGSIRAALWEMVCEK
jgi:hypothetical protein